MTVRKNFLFEDKVAQHLEEMSKSENKSMTAIVQEMIEQRYKEIEKEKKLKAFRSFKPFSGVFVDKSIQSIKAEMGYEKLIVKN